MARQAKCGHGVAHSHFLCKPCVDHFSRLPETVNYAPANVDEHLRADVEKYGAEVPRKRREKGPSATTRQALLDAANSAHKEIKIVDPAPKQFVDLNDPAVAEHAAGVIVRNVLDYPKSAKQLQPTLSPVDSAIFAHQLKTSPVVQQAVTNELARLGLDQKGREQFFAILWNAARDDRPQAEHDRLQSWRLLSRLYLPSENPSGKNEAPAALPIAGFQEGLDSMGLTKEVLNSVPAGAFTAQQTEAEAADEDGED